jgi:type I restriction enzyme S subunit
MSSLQYKDYNWLGDTPANWTIVPAKSLFSNPVEPNHVDDIHLTPSQKFGVIPQSEYMERTGNRVVLNLSGAEKMRHVEPGDYVSHLRSFQGGLEYSPYRGKVSTAYTVLRPKRVIDSRFFKYLFKSDRYVQGLSTTTEQLRDGQSIRYEQFGLLPLPYPPIEEQKAIADFLDIELASIDRLVEKQNCLSSVLEEKKNALIADALEKAGSSRKIKLSWCFNFMNGDRGVNYPAPEEIQDSGVPFINAGDLVDGLVSEENLKYVSQEKFATMGGAKLVDGDILYCLRGSVGKSAIFRGYKDGTLASSLVALRNKAPDVISTEFCFLLLNSSHERVQRAHLMSGSAQPNLAADALAKMEFFIPSIADQNKLISKLLRINHEISGLVERARAANSILHERRTALISAAVTGKIKVWGK